MKKIFLLLILTGVFMMFGCKNMKKIDYPLTAKVDTVDIYFGVEVPDPYRWLEDDNSEETAAWVKAENEITEDYLSDIPFRDDLRKRLTELWNYPKYGVPYKKGDHYFFFKNDGLQNQSVFYIMDALDAEPRVLLDPNKFSEDGTIALSNVSISNDGHYLAYSTANAGSDWSEIYVMDINTGEKLPDHVKWVKFSGISWKADGFYYSAYDEPDEDDVLSGRNEYHKVKYHKLGTPSKGDKTIFEASNHPLRNFHAQVTEDEKFLFIYETESTSGNALYFKNLAKNGKDFIPIAPGFDYEYNVIDNIGDKIYIKTNHHAPTWKLMLADASNPQLENWETLIAEKPEVLESIDLIGGKLIGEYMKDAYSKAMIYDQEGNFLEDMKLPGIGTLYSLNGEKDEDQAFFGFTSFTFPSTNYLFNVKENTFKVYNKPDLDFDADDFVTRQVFFTSKDGTKVPMFIVHKKGLGMNGDNPALLYGYGGFNISMTPSFSITRSLFIEQGGVYALVNLRGGGEYGEEWHQGGMKMNKQNVFDDFIAATEYLIQNNYTNSSKTAIMGGSNGGLLVGACMIQRPELFAVAIPQVGVMDMLRYHLFTIGWAWASDYGSSADSKEMFEYLYGYSPIHTIKKGVKYPATLVTTADHDDRVVPAHSFKFISTLQEKGGGNNPYLILIETKAGHGGGKPTSKIIQEYADIYSFMMYNLDMDPEFD